MRRYNSRVYYSIRDYTTNPTVDFNLSNVFNARGNIYEMQLTHMHYNLRKHFFSIRIIAVWKSS